MDLFALAMLVISLVIKLIPIAEEIFKDEPKSGVKKKALVEFGVKTAMEVRGQKGAWDKIKVPLGLTIDAVCDVIYAKGKLDGT